MKSLKHSPKEVWDSIYYELFKSTVFNDLSNSKLYAQKSLLLSNTYGHINQLAKANRAIAYILNIEGKKDSALYYSYKGIYFSKHAGVGETSMAILNDIGSLYENKDFYDSALKFYSEALYISVSINSKDGQSAIYNNIGLIYYNLENHEEALKNYNKSLSIKRDNNIQDNLENNLYNIALIYIDLNRPNEANKILVEFQDLCKTGCSKKDESELMYCFGYLNELTGNEKRSKEYFERSIKLARASKNQKTLASALHHLSLLVFNDENMESALIYLAEAEVIVRQINLRRLVREIYNTYKIIYTQQGERSLAFDYLIKYTSLKDSIFNEQVAFNISRIQIDAQQKQSDLILQQKEAQLSRSRWIIAFIVVVALLLVAVSILLYNRYRLNKRLKQILDKQVKLRTSDLMHSN